ncbi:phosphotransferase [Streptomyces sp. NPDC048696]|uniref:phosphotransferase n=1 Tax=Streptomyces sp. NPDC048696 TaxID=3365585 RepID=UPI00371B4F3C
MATYTKLDDIDLSAVAYHYGLGPIRLAPLPGGAANSSFRVTAASGSYVLTILDNHDTAGARRLAAHTQALFLLGVPTSEVVPTVDGAPITRLRGRGAVLKKWIEGTVRQPLPLAHLPAAGRMLAELHALPPASPGLADIPVGTRRLTPQHQALITEFTDKEFAAWLTTHLDHVHTAEAANPRTRRVVHGDFFDDNIVVRTDGGLSLLDWETLTLDDPLLDLGAAAVGVGREAGLLAPERLRALVSGYEQVAPLSDADRADLPMEITHAALIIAFHRYRRHHIRFPDPRKSGYHMEMVTFVDSVAEGTRALGGANG